MIKKIYKKMFSENFRNGLLINLRKVNSLFMKGENFYCPCCENTFSRFLNKGNGIIVRKNAICPRCGSLERSRLLYLYLSSETDLFEENKSILHFAPEDFLKKKLLSNPHYYDADLNPDAATYQMDITDIKFEDEKFDFIICCHVLGHVPDEDVALSEMYRVLKTGGSIFFQSLMDENLVTTLEDCKYKTAKEKLQNYGESDLMRLYGIDFSHRIAITGFTVERIDYRKNFTPEDQQKMALGDGKREIIFKVQKKII